MKDRYSIATARSRVPARTAPPIIGVFLISRTNLDGKSRVDCKKTNYSALHDVYYSKSGVGIALINCTTEWETDTIYSTTLVTIPVPTAKLIRAVTTI